MAKLAEKVEAFLKMFGESGEKVLEKAAANEKAADKTGLASKEHDDEETTTTESLKHDESTAEEGADDELDAETQEFAEALTEAIDERVLEILPTIMEEIGKTETKERDQLLERLEKLETSNTTLKEQNKVMADALKELLGEMPTGLKKFVASQSEKTKTTTKETPKVVDPADSFRDEFIGNFVMRPAQFNGRQE